MAAIVLSVALLLGVAAGVQRSLDQPALLLAGGAAIVALPLGWRLPGARWLALLTAACVLGAWRAVSLPPLTQDSLTPLLGQPVALTARVVAGAEPRGQTAILDVEVAEARTAAAGTAAAGTAAAATVLASGPNDRWPRVEVSGPRDGPLGRLATGDWVALEGRLAVPVSSLGFPRADLLRRRGVLSTLAFPRVSVLERTDWPADPQAVASGVRQAIRDGFRQYLPGPRAALTFGMLLGGSSDLPADVRRQLQVAGLGHLVAVSGLNVVLVTGAVAWVLGRLVGRRAATLPSLVAVVAYTVLVGAPASAVRAAVMAGGALVAGAVGRIPDPLTSVSVAAALMALFDPLVLLDLGFQLSLAATLGLVLLYPRIRPALAYLRIPRLLAEPLALALAAELATLPIVLSVFHQVSLVAPLANVLAAPLVPGVMLTGGLLALTLPVPPVAAIAAAVAWLPTGLLLELARRTSELPGALLSTGALPPAGVLVLSAALLAWGLAPLPEVRQIVGAAAAAIARGLGPARRPAAVVAATLGAALAVGAGSAVVRGDGLLHVSALGTQRGTVYLVRGPSGATVLVAGEGADGRALVALLGERLNVWERGLAAAVVLAPVPDAGIAEALRRYPAPVTLRPADGDARLDLGEGAVLDVLVPGAAGVAEATVSHGAVRLTLVGGAPAASAADDAEVAFRVLFDASSPSAGDPGAEPKVLRVRPPRGGALELVSDGYSVWPTSTSGQTTSAATPG